MTRDALRSEPGSPFDEPRRLAAGVIDWIRQSARAAKFSVAQPMTFAPVTNLRAAKALRVTMPLEIMVHATRAIQ